MTGQQKNDFATQLKEHEERFIGAGSDVESDEQLADALVRFILERRRILTDVEHGTAAAVAVDQETLKLMREWDPDDPALSTLEKVLRRFSTGRGVEAIELLKRAVINRAEALSDEQRRKAKVPRRKHPIDVLIDQEVERNPKISAPELERALERQIGKGVIFDMDGDRIDFVDDCIKPVKISGLKDRLTDAKKRALAKAG